MFDDLSIDYTSFTTAAIKLFLDLLHHIQIDIEEIELHVVLELLCFLHSEGKTMISELETKLADYLYDTLTMRDMTDDMILLVAYILSTFDNSNSKFEDSRASKIEISKVVEGLVKFDARSDQYSPILQGTFLKERKVS